MVEVYAVSFILDNPISKVFYEKLALKARKGNRVERVANVLVRACRTTHPHFIPQHFSTFSRVGEDEVYMRNICSTGSTTGRSGSYPQSSRPQVFRQTRSAPHLSPEGNCLRMSEWAALPDWRHCRWTHDVSGGPDFLKCLRCVLSSYKDRSPKS